MNINVYNLESPNIIATNIWKYFYATHQYRESPNKPKFNISFNDGTVLTNDGVSILHVGFSAIKHITKEHINSYDVVIIDNNVDHVQVHDELIYRYITEYDHVYFLVGGFVSKEYDNSSKIITYPADWIDCIQLYTDPMCFTRYSINISGDKHGIVFIGGALRSWRKYIIDNLPQGIKIHQKSSEIAGTKHIIGGTKYDSPFIDMCNKTYGVCETITPNNEFYEHITLGLEHLPTGGVRLGYHALPMYSDAQCIVFPEACFVNHHVFPTEKVWKCVASKTHWVMFSGSESYSIMRDYGIRSILELTPFGIEFDHIDDHAHRFETQMKSIQYLVDHQSIFETSDAKSILNDNYQSFYNNHKIVTQLSDAIDIIIQKQ